ncbi:fatty acyl-CoA reductase 1-like [Culicoides brevitarsis]|uniref:fatty acyl-CoA reductase 1-like n=1 Tax=Culicoides brevitarsis TaxID=469753 RepID=UPI00307CAE96
MNPPLPKVFESYHGKSIFITGSTGFLGKVLLEKLLFSCPDIKKIYILIREKRGLSSKERFDKFISHEIFHRIRQKNPSILEKLYLVEGDCLSDKLGIKEDDRQLLISSVNIIFHVVAQVKFNQPIQSAVDFNVNGSLRILNLAMEMTHLEHFVYISTAYVNPWKHQVPEKVEPFSLTGWSPNEILILSESQTKILNGRVSNGGIYPNTYTLTKHMAEHLVVYFSKKLKKSHTTIVRPSIVTAAAYEPFIGWTDSFNGPAAIMVETARGTIKSVIGDGNKVADVIPVDLVANTIIASVWHQTIE